MQKYRIDWKSKIYGSIELEAINGQEADEKFRAMLLKDLFQKSNFVSDNGKRKIRFVETGKFFDLLSNDEWEFIKRYL